MKIADRKQCTGCGACADICPAACISVGPMDEGFFFPSVDSSRGTECDLCGKTCPVLNPSEKRFPRNAFAAWALDGSVRIGLLADLDKAKVLLKQTLSST